MEQVADVCCLLRKEIVGELGHRLADHMSLEGLRRSNGAKLLSQLKLRDKLHDFFQNVKDINVNTHNALGGDVYILPTYSFIFFQVI